MKVYALQCKFEIEGSDNQFVMGGWNTPLTKLEAENYVRTHAKGVVKDDGTMCPGEIYTLEFDVKFPDSLRKRLSLIWKILKNE